MESNSFFEDVVTAYKIGVVAREVRDANHKKQLIGAIKDRIIRAANDGEDVVKFTISEIEIPYIEFVRHWVHENNLRMYPLEEVVDGVMILHISGWAG